MSLSTDSLTEGFESIIPGEGSVGIVLMLGAIAFALSGLRFVLPSELLIVLEVGITFMLYSMVVLGMNLQFGYTDLVNFGPVAFVAVGAYTTAVLTSTNPYYGMGFGLPWYVGLLAGVALAIILGVLLGFSTLRLRGDYLAIVTLAAAEILHTSFSSLQGIFGGQFGITNVPTPLHAIASTGQTGTAVTLLFYLGVMLVFYGVFKRLSEAPYGRLLRAIRADNKVTKALGKNTFRYKLQVFVYGGAVAGLAGGLLALHNGVMSPGFVTIELTITVWIGMIIGGAQNYRGVLGGLLIIMGFRLATRFLSGIIPVSQTSFASVRVILVGLLLVLAVRYRPEGLWGDKKKLGYD